MTIPGIVDTVDGKPDIHTAPSDRAAALAKSFQKDTNICHLRNGYVSVTDASKASSLDCFSGGQSGRTGHRGGVSL
jgi:hypothetical protein